MVEEIDFKELMSKKSDDGLNQYLLNIQRYKPEAINAAINELKSRGRVFTDKEFHAIQSELKKKDEIQKKEDEQWSRVNFQYIIGAIGLLYCAVHFFPQKPLSKNDVVSVRGTLKSVEWITRRKTSELQIRVNEYENRFFIGSLLSSRSNQIYNNVREGNDMEILIDKESRDKVGESDLRIEILALTSAQIQYFSLQHYADLYADKNTIWMVILILISGVLFFLGFKKKSVPA